MQEISGAVDIVILWAYFEWVSSDALQGVDTRFQFCSSSHQLLFLLGDPHVLALQLQMWPPVTIIVMMG